MSTQGAHKYLIIKKTVISTDSGTATPATVAWGPDFGNPTELEAGVSGPAFTDLALSSTDLLIGGSLRHTDLAISSTDPAVGSRLAFDLGMTSTDLFVGTNMIAESAVAQSATNLVGSAVRFTDLAMSSIDLAVGGAARLTDLALEAPTDLAVGVDTTSLTWNIPLYASEQEVWWDELAACVGTTNHPNEDLQIDGVVATRKDALWKWDFFNFDANATVTAASLRVRVKTAPAVAVTCNLRAIANATEDWDEALQDCGQNPTTAGGTTQSFAIPAATGEITVVLNNDWLTRISTRFGAGPNFNGNCSMYARSNLADVAFTLEGANADADRPRLINLTWSTPT